MTQQSDHFSRHAGFELLRILSMMMIVLMHGIGHGGLGTTAAPGTFPYFIYWLLFMLGRVSTNCFVMLTGYFMWQSKTKVSRLFRIEMQVLFYSLLTFVIGLFVNSVSLSAGTLLRAVFPTTSCVYWFCSCYFILYLAIPLLNKIIASLTRAQYRFMLIVLFLLFSLWSTVCFWSGMARVENGYSYVWFFVLYFTAAYLSIYQVRMSSALCLSLYFVFSCSLFWCGSLPPGSKHGWDWKECSTHSADTSLRPCFSHPFASFVLPEYQNSGQSPEKIILAIAPLSFGVYLLHDSDFTRAFLWEKSRFPVLEACLRPLATWLSQPFASPVQGILSIRCIKKFTGWSFGKKRRGKWMRSQHGFIGASEKASEAFHSP
ncbi:MAG: acyltransferase family protein [Gallintestinimicrobium sp.]